MRQALLIIMALAGMLPVRAQVGDMVNLVCFVRFADESEDIFTHSPEWYEALYNRMGEDVNSVRNYFSWASYGRLDWRSQLYPQASAGATCVASYQDPLKRGQLQPYSAANPIGYTSAVTASNLEHELVGRVAAYLDGLLPDGLKLDNYKEGSVDNLTIIYSGNSESSSSKGILWPHQDNIMFSTYRIKGCRVPRYLAVFDRANGYRSFKPIEINTGVLCHEMTHVLGAYDLYTSSSDTSNPVGTWDLMSDNNLVPQGLTAYTRWMWGKWIDKIPQITEDGYYRLHPVGGKSNHNVAFMIRTSRFASEYFIVEYRKKEGIFESGIPRSGLICYRISTTASGNLGTDKELYIFRQNGTSNYEDAVVTADIGLTEMNTEASPIKIRFSSGNRVNFCIRDVSACGETITFAVEGLAENTDALRSVRDAQSQEADGYSLDGRKVGAGYRGIVVRNGRKTLIK